MFLNFEMQSKAKFAAALLPSLMASMTLVTF